MSERAKDWQRLVRAWQRSGLSQAAFCRQHGLSPVTFSSWRHRIASPAAVVPEARRFVEVALAPGEREVYEVRLRCGRTVRVPAGFQADDLARLIAAVESC